jgi:hypothetical protein
MNLLGDDIVTINIDTLIAPSKPEGRGFEIKWGEILNLRSALVQKSAEFSEEHFFLLPA